MALERVRRSDENDPIYVLDLSQLREPEYLETLARFRLFVETHSVRKGLLIVDVTNTTATPGILKGLKDTAACTVRNFRARAVVGVKPIQMMLLHAVSAFARIHLEPCPNQSEAERWLRDQARAELAERR